MRRAPRILSVGLAGLVGALIFAPAATTAQDRFVTGMEDVPLMPGLSEAPDGGVIFDTPSGRIAQAYATGEVSPSVILSFYDEALPHLGWRLLGDGRFQREGEELTMELHEARASSVAVRFVLSPSREGRRPETMREPQRKEQRHGL